MAQKVQTTFPNMRDKKVEEIETAAEHLETADDQLGKAREKKATANERMIDVLTKHKIKSYRYGTLSVKLTDKKVVQAKRIADKV